MNKSINESSSLPFLKNLTLFYIVLSLFTSFLIVYLFVPQFSPSALQTDFGYYRQSSINGLVGHITNYGFSFIISILKLKNPSSLKAAFFAYLFSTLGYLLLIISFNQKLKYEGYTNKSIKKILIVFTIFISLNPYFSISRLLFRPESFIYIGIGLLYLIYNLLTQKINIFQKNLRNFDIFKHILSDNLFLFFIFLLVASIRNVLFLNLISIFLIIVKSPNFRNFNIRNIQKLLPKSKYDAYKFILIFIILIFFIFNLYMVINNVIFYVSQQNGILEPGGVYAVSGSNPLNSIIKIVFSIPKKIILLLGFRAAVANSSNIFIDIHNNIDISRNILVTNILPPMFYLSFNAMGIFFICKYRHFRDYILIVLPSLLPILLGPSHIRYLYPAVPAITLGWSLFFVNNKITNKKIWDIIDNYIHRIKTKN